MSLSFWGISLLAAVLQFIVGGIWYTPLFGTLWGKIHGFDALDKKTQEKMMGQMAPLFAGQFIVTVITTVVMAALHQMLPTFSLYLLMGLVWGGFILPAQVSSVLFGGTPFKWILPKIAVQAGGSLVCLLVGSAVISYFL